MCGNSKVLAVLDNFGAVTQCGCGSIHLSVGPVSVAVDSATLRKLHQMLEAALEHADSDDLRQLTSAEHSHLAVRRVVKLKH
jgi:hypothetical protein